MHVRVQRSAETYTATAGYAQSNLARLVEPYVSKEHLQDTYYDGWCTMCEE